MSVRVCMGAWFCAIELMGMSACVERVCVFVSVHVRVSVTNVAAQWLQVGERIEDFCLNWFSHFYPNHITPTSLIFFN